MAYQPLHIIFYGISTSVYYLMPKSVKCKQTKVKYKMSKLMQVAKMAER